MTARVIVCLDGCGPDYLEAAATPNLDALAREGYHIIGEAVVPTVTNVNNTSIITASFPETHGITTNYLLDPISGAERYMEDAGDLLAETAFRRIAKKGGRSVTYPPESEIAQANVREIDRLIGEIVNAAGDLEMVVTADHGMTAKSCGLDLEAILKTRGILAQVIPIIKDRHVVHHRNLGGAAYVYLRDPAREAEAAAVLAEEKGIEAVLTREAAALEYRLHPGRIGHLFVLADRDTVFGTLGALREELSVRSHGSLHERAIPIYACGAGPLAVRPHSNPEIAPWLFSGLVKGSLS